MSTETPFAILYLPEAKAGHSLPFYGRSAKKYTFVPCPLVNNKPARVYHDPEVFAREELDMRRNIKPTAVVCVSIGAANPIIRAESAVRTLADSRQTLGAGAVRDALLSVVALATAAVDVLNKTVAAPPSTSPESTPPVIVSSSPESKPAPTEQPPADGAPATSSVNPGETPATNDAPPILNQPSLQVLEIDKLRAIADYYKTTKRSRAEMVAAILIKQAELVPA
jgi:hypothetical protein